MEKSEVLDDLLQIFKDNKGTDGLTSVHGVYDSLKEYMLKLKAEIEIENN